ncbi:hypothetical protein EDB81DRAFT_401482 [Dactylonectria macrodidyma]|uniref:Uncharacterized protein n=1 Tax=Dactylonectria macrodidyma TaxID=307937 RepID=A0A9P9FAF7_9HYPO|nr:hypothetical protein EDB81DRAFT_401482 [Dactylonectria macrodidyma]
MVKAEVARPQSDLGGISMLAMLAAKASKQSHISQISEWRGDRSSSSFFRWPFMFVCRRTGERNFHGFPFDVFYFPFSFFFFSPLGVSVGSCSLVSFFICRESLISFPGAGFDEGGLRASCLRPNVGHDGALGTKSNQQHRGRSWVAVGSDAIFMMGYWIIDGNSHAVHGICLCLKPSDAAMRGSRTTWCLVSRVSREQGRLFLHDER